MPDEFTSLDRRKFLTVLGARGRSARAERAARRARSRSWCRTWCSRRIRSPASPPGTPAPAPNAPPAAACTCARARAGRSSSRAIPSIRSTRASSARGVRRRSRGSTIPAGSRRPMARAADGSFKEITWDDAIGRAGRQGRRRQGGGDLGGGAGHPLRSAERVDRGRSAAAWCAGSRSITSRSAPPTSRCSAPTGCRRTTSPRPSTSSLSARTFSIPGSRRSRISAALPSRTASRAATWPSWSTPARAWTSPASTPTSGSRSSRAPKRRWRWRWHRWLPRSVAALLRLERLYARGRREGNRNSRRADREDRQGVRGRAAESGGGRRHRCPARRCDRALRRGQHPQLRRGEHRADGQLRRRPRSG